MSRVLFYLGYQLNQIDLSNGLQSISLGGSESCVVQLAYQLVKDHPDCHVTIVGSNLKECLLQHGSIRCVTTDTLRKECLTYDYFYDRVIAVNYIHYLLELDFLQWNSSIFWLHNTEPFPYYNGATLDNNGYELMHDDRLNLIVCVSEIQAIVVREQYPDLQHKIIVIENGFNHSQIPVIRNKHNNIKKQLSFVYGSAVDRGLDNILKIWETLCPSLVKLGYDPKLTVCCPIYSEQFLEAVTRPFKSLPSVEFSGSLNKEDWLQLASTQDYWLYPTEYFETFCITGYELLASHVFPLITDVGNLKTITTMLDKYLPDRPRSLDTMGLTFGDTSIVTQIIDRIQYIESIDKSLLFEHIVCDIAHNDWSNIVNKWTPYLLLCTSEKLSQNITIISLQDPKQSMDRWTAEIDKSGLTSDKGVYVLPAVNGNDVDEHYLIHNNYQLYNNWKLPYSSNSWWNRDLLPGEIGCALSHFNAWNRFIKTNQPYAVIFEDDFTSTNIEIDDLMLAQLPCDWDMLYLGRNALTKETHDKTLCVVKPGPSYNMHAYVLTRKGAIKLLQQNFQQMIMPVDEFIQATYTTHQREDLRNIWQDNIAYAFNVEIFNQQQPNRTTTSQTETIHLSQLVKDKSNSEITLYDYFEYQEQWLRKYIMPSALDMDFDLAIDEPIPYVYCWKMFTDAFCDEVIATSEKVNGWTTDRHIFYPTTDMVLTSIGLNDIYNDLMCKYVEPVITHVYQLDGNGWKGMKNENFVARYTQDTQSQLKIHHDSSDITALVNLSQPEVDFTGGGTYFPKYKQLYRPIKGSISVHPGNITHKHGARQVWTGSRYIMVSFMSRSDR